MNSGDNSVSGLEELWSVIGDNLSTKMVRRDRLLRLGGGVVGNSSIDLRLSLSTIFRGGSGGGDGDRP